MSDVFEPYMKHGLRRTADGGAVLLRPNKQVEDILDSVFTRDPRQHRKWFPKIKESFEIARLQNRFLGTICYIIGKGPSLDLLSKHDFKEDQPIICINESIKVVERLGLENPLFCIIGDINLDCEPLLPRTELLLMRQVSKLYPEHKRYVFDATQLSDVTLGIVRACKIARIMGCSELVFLGCDAALTDNCDYAASIGYDSGKGGHKSRFLGHKAIVEAESDLPCNWHLPVNYA